MTKAYILDSVALAQGFITALVENQAVVSGGTSATDTASIPGSATNQAAFAFASPSGEPGVADWNFTGPYHLVIDVSSLGANLSLVSATATARYAFYRVSADLSTALNYMYGAGYTWDTTTGTGLHTLTQADVITGSGATDRFVAAVCCANSSSMTAQNLVLNLGTATEYMDGGWAGGAAPDTRVPYVNHMPQLLAH